MEDSAVSHVDIFPTILDAVDLSAPKRVHGQSLLPVIAGENIETLRDVYSESLYPLLHYGWAPLRAIRTDNRKLISAPQAGVAVGGAGWQAASRTASSSHG